MQTNVDWPLSVTRLFGNVVECAKYLGVLDVYATVHTDTSVEFELTKTEDMDKYFVQNVRVSYDPDKHTITLFQGGMFGYDSHWEFGEEFTLLNWMTLYSVLSEMKHTPDEVEEGFYETQEERSQGEQILKDGIV